MNLNTARVFVHDIDAARDFYAQRPGLPIQHDGSEQGFCVFKPGRSHRLAPKPSAQE